jgi:transcriptional regulator with XRE-family HTH domain
VRWSCLSTSTWVTFIHVTGSVGSSSPEQRFGYAVRDAREKRGLSQEALAGALAEAGINVGGQSGVARIEKGLRPTRLNEVVDIAQHLDIDLTSISAAGIRIASREDADSAIAELAKIMADRDQWQAVRDPIVETLEQLDAQIAAIDRRRTALQMALGQFAVGQYPNAEEYTQDMSGALESMEAKIAAEVARVRKLRTTNGEDSDGDR